MYTITQKAVSKMSKRVSKDITDKVFLTIQNDHDLMYDYLSAVEEHGVAAINRQIGKEVKATFGLVNASTRGKHPVSTLIQSYQKLQR